jgi:hypothetical protein
MGDSSNGVDGQTDGHTEERKQEQWSGATEQQRTMRKLPIFPTRKKI